MIKRPEVLRAVRLWETMPPGAVEGLVGPLGRCHRESLEDKLGGDVRLWDLARAARAEWSPWSCEKFPADIRLGHQDARPTAVSWTGDMPEYDDPG
jgi:hypothetical protein